MNRLEFAASRIANEPRDAAEALRRFAEEEAAKKKERVYARASEKKSALRRFERDRHPRNDPTAAALDPGNPGNPAFSARRAFWRRR